jgi:hypothetical protein
MELFQDDIKMKLDNSQSMYLCLEVMNPLGFRYRDLGGFIVVYYQAKNGLNIFIDVINVIEFIGNLESFKTFLLTIYNNTIKEIEKKLKADKI